MYIQFCLHCRAQTLDWSEIWVNLEVRKAVCRNCTKDFRIHWLDISSESQKADMFSLKISEGLRWNIILNPWAEFGPRQDVVNHHWLFGVSGGTIHDYFFLNPGHKTSSFQHLIIPVLCFNNFIWKYVFLLILSGSWNLKPLPFCYFHKLTFFFCSLLPVYIFCQAKYSNFSWQPRQPNLVNQQKG